MRYVLFALLLAGCATSQEVRDTGEKIVVGDLARPPAVAAACMARNIENDRPVFGTVPVRPLERDSWEVIYRTGPETVLAVVHVEPDGPGSRATIWLKGHWFYRRGDLVPTMLKGC